MSDFTEFTKDEFEQTLDTLPVDFECYDHPSAKEYVYDAVLRENDASVVLRVYSSVDKQTDTARPKGEDAIRCMLVLRYTRPDPPDLLSTTKKTLRTDGWESRLAEKCRDLIDRADEYKTCERCGRLMVLRTNVDDVTFWGCEGYSDEYVRCTYTESV